MLLLLCLPYCHGMAWPEAASACRPDHFQTIVVKEPGSLQGLCPALAADDVPISHGQVQHHPHEDFLELGGHPQPGHLGLDTSFSAD